MQDIRRLVTTKLEVVVTLRGSLICNILQAVKNMLLVYDLFVSLSSVDSLARG